MRHLLRAIADFAFPRQCLVCGRELMPSEEDLCLVCASDLPLTRYAQMARNPIADRFNARIAQKRPDCFEPYAYATALFHYIPESEYSAITRDLKYRRAFSQGRHFARMLGEELAVSPLFRDVDTVVPVPLHSSRLRSRGYNQAEIIAGEVAGKLPAANLDCGILERSRKTSSQASLDISQKAENVKDAFRVKKSALKSWQSGKRAVPRHLLLIDDVFTTGSTLAECHSALRAALPAGTRISMATLGAVGRD